MVAGRANYEAQHADRVVLAKANYKARNKDKIASYNSQRYCRMKETLSRQKRDYNAAKPWVRAENERTRRARKLQAMPLWVDRDKIKEVYRRAAEVSAATGVKHSVDHVYPLRGRDSCGLHVPWNLQVLTFEDNCRKGTKSPEQWGGENRVRG
jgi:hypothetical protein